MVDASLPRLTSQVTIACRDTDPDLFFSKRKADVEKAKAFCRSCRIRLACLENTLDTERDLGHQLEGVHGGLTKAERANTTFRRIDGGSIHRRDVTNEQGLRAAAG